MATENRRFSLYWQNHFEPNRTTGSLCKCPPSLKKSASNEDMKKAYRKEVRKAHPDKGGSAELFRKIRQAWEYFTKV